MKSGLSNLSVWFGIIMILIVVTGAIAVSFTDFMSDRLFGTKRVFFVILLLAYAVYRGFRLYAFFKDNRDENE